MFQQGDIVVVPFPFTDLSSSKLRPALVISNGDKLIETGDTIVVMITTKPKQDGINILIKENDASILLPESSFVRCHRITAIDNTIIRKKVGSVTAHFFTEVITSVISLFDRK